MSADDPRDRLLQRLRNLGDETAPLVSLIERLQDDLDKYDAKFVERMRPIAAERRHDDYVRAATHQHLQSREYLNRQLGAALKFALDILPPEIPVIRIVAGHPTLVSSGDR